MSTKQLMFFFVALVILVLASAQTTQWCCQFGSTADSNNSWGPCCSTDQCREPSMKYNQFENLCCSVDQTTGVWSLIDTAVCQRAGAAPEPTGPCQNSPWCPESPQYQWMCANRTDAAAPAFFDCCGKDQCIHPFEDLLTCVVKDENGAWVQAPSTEKCGNDVPRCEKPSSCDDTSTYEWLCKVVDAEGTLSYVDCCEQCTRPFEPLCIQTTENGTSSVDGEYCGQEDKPTDKLCGNLPEDCTPEPTTNYQWLCKVVNGRETTYVDCCKDQCTRPVDEIRVCVETIANQIADHVNCDKELIPTCQGQALPDHCTPEPTTNYQWLCKVVNGDQTTYVDCCKDQCTRPVDEIRFCVETIAGEVVHHEKCDKGLIPTCQGQDLPEHCTQTPKYEFKCTVGNVLSANPVYQDCDCSNFLPEGSTCGNVTPRKFCIDTATNTPVSFNLCINSASTNVSPTLSCGCKGQWWCKHTIILDSGEQQTIYGPCGCEKFEYNQHSPKSNTADGTTAISRPQDGFDLCPDGTESFTLAPVCLQFTNSTLILSDHCDDSTRPDDLVCPCPEEERKTEWVCSLNIGGSSIYVPCDDFCKIAERYGSKLCHGYKFNTHCALMNENGTINQIISDSECDATTIPTEPSCLQDISKKCRHYWQCTVVVDSNTITFPCNQISEICRKVRFGIPEPCGDFDVNVQCISEVTGNVTNDESLCPQPKPVTSFVEHCPPVSDDCCDDGSDDCGKKYEWQCYGKGVDAEGNSVVIPSDTITFGEQPYIKCGCGPSCHAYEIGSICVEQGTNNQVSSTLCNPQTNPAPYGQKCPRTLPDSQCGGGEPVEPCQLICSIQFNGQDIYFPCEHYKEYCHRFSFTYCGDFDIKAHCGSLSADGEFFEAKDQSCCKRRQLAWGGAWFPGVEFDCSKVVALEKPADPIVTTAVTDNLFEELATIMPIRPCKYAWECKDGVQVCVRWSANSPTPVVIADQFCSEYPKPSDEECKPQEERKYQYFCRDALAPNSTWQPCDGGCDEYQSCKGTRVIAQCHSIASGQLSWVIDNNANCQAANVPGPFPGGALVLSCPGNPELCEPVEPEPEYNWRCFVNGSPFYQVPCQCEDIVEQFSLDVVRERFGCEFKLSASCFDSFGNVVMNSLCVPPSGPLDSGVWDVCNVCEPNKRVELSCFRNGLVTQPVDCKHACKLRGDCESYFIQAVCHIVGQPTQPVPLSECQQQFNQIQSLTSPAFDADGIKRCQSSKYDKACNAKWVCRAWVGGDEYFEYDCGIDICENYPSPCTGAKVENVCVVYAPGEPENVDLWTQVSPNVCNSVGLIPPLGQPGLTTACPLERPAYCDKTHEWMCVDQLIDAVTGNHSLSAPYPCPRQPSCKQRPLFHANPCREFAITAMCFATVWNPITNAVETTQVAGNNCDWSTYPIRDGSNSPISLRCRCPKKCTNGANNWPRCNRWLIDTPIVIDDGIIWDVNPTEPNEPVDPCLEDTGVVLPNTGVIFTSDAFHFNTLSKSRTNIRSGSLPLADGIDTRSLKNVDATTATVQATIISPCGDIEGPIIDVPSWCSLAKCAKPFICSERLRACVCPPGTWGKQCELSKCPEGMELSTSIDRKVPRCICIKGHVWDEESQTCVKKCPIKEFDCGKNGKWNKKTCKCECTDGFFTIAKEEYPQYVQQALPGTQIDSGPCGCFETFFKVTFAKQPEFEGDVAELWKQLLIEYFQFDTATIGFELDLDIIETLVDRDGSFVLTIRFRTCDPKLYELFKFAYRLFVNSYNNNNNNNNNSAPFIALAESDAPTFTFDTLLKSDIVNHAGGIVGFTSTSESGPQENNTTIISSLFAVIVAVVIAIVM